MSGPTSLRAVSLESRNALEMSRLLSRHGVQPIEAPSMKEASLADQTHALAFGEVLMSGGCDALILLTGVGTRMLLAALSTRWPQASVVERWGQLPLLCRGPKPVAVLKSLGLKPTLVAPSPNTWRELVAAIDASFEVAGKALWVQEYGRAHPELAAALERRGARVHALPIYAWELPEDLAPLRSAIELLCEGAADAVLFTSAQQCDHLLTVAAQMGCRERLLSALAERVLVVSVGPVTSEALAEAGITVDLEPEHPKMGQMVRAVAERGAQLLDDKRSHSA